MAAILDVCVPSRRRERRHQRELEQNLHSRFGDTAITAPNDGGWNQVGTISEPEKQWDVQFTQPHGSPDTAKSSFDNSPEPTYPEEHVIIVGEDPIPPPQTSPKNSFTITIPLPWTSKRGHSRSASVASNKAHDLPLRFSPPPTTQSPAHVYTAASHTTTKDLADLARRGSPAISSVLSIAPSTSPSLETQRSHHNNSAFAVLSPVSEDFAKDVGYMGFTPGGLPPRHFSPPLATVENFSRPRLPSPPLAQATMERPSTSTSIRSDLQRPRTTSTSRPTVAYAGSVRSLSRGPTPANDASGMARSASRGPGLDMTSRMRASSREPVSRRAMSREPEQRRPESHGVESRRATSRGPETRRAMSREPLGRRAPSCEPIRGRAPTPPMTVNCSFSSDEDHTETTDTDTETVTSASSYFEAQRPTARKDSAAGYYTGLADEYKHIARDVEVQNLFGPESDPMGLVSTTKALSGAEGDGRRMRSASKTRAQRMNEIAYEHELVPKGEDLWS